MPVHLAPAGCGAALPASGHLLSESTLRPSGLSPVSRTPQPASIRARAVTDGSSKVSVRRNPVEVAPYGTSPVLSGHVTEAVSSVSTLVRLGETSSTDEVLCVETIRPRTRESSGFGLERGRRDVAARDQTRAADHRLGVS